MSLDEQAVRNVIAEWQAATLAGDLPRVLALMTDDVVYLTAGQPPFGKEQFAAAFQAMAGRNVRIEPTSEVEEVQVVGDMAYCRTHIRVTVTVGHQQPRIRSGHTLTIFRKQSDGRWLLARDANLMTMEA
ncbi:YybH family protein [Limnoglobus roseus]|uniref:DUF4440 domain-containing protein n=1 Tax=Limnoglobus roseus TaxID=2598579 RepID=A0A5C1A480_9BACT|nr:SgcJ/EcaC family oxidoreductase [Limnoglobus roseus]QEL13177.1 hypothetical protein PX52LOC_00030 [Limnoglobus roseus]